MPSGILPNIHSDAKRQFEIHPKIYTFVKKQNKTVTFLFFNRHLNTGHETGQIQK
jgi:hypothetical protein